MIENGRHVTCAWDFHDGARAEIVYVQFSDVPRSGLMPGQTLDRLPAGRGGVPFGAFARETLEAAGAVRATA